MSRVLYGNLDLASNQLLNFLLQVLASDPLGTEAKMYYNSTSKEIRYFNGTSWQSLDVAGASAPPNGTAGGDLSGTYPNPQIATGAIVDNDVNASANIAQSKISGLAATFATKADNTVAVTAGAGLVGGGNMTASRTLDVGAGSGITVAADSISADGSVVQLRSERGVANGYPTLDSSALIPTGFLPPLAVNEVFTAASQAAMLALNAQRGDMCIRTDIGTSWVLSADTPSVLAAWKEVMAAGQVLSVNSQTGVVSITAASISAVPTSRSVIAGNGLTGGGTLAADATLNVVGDATLSVSADTMGVVSAPKWTTARTITLGGDLTGNTSIDGTGNVTLTAALAAGAGGKRYAVALGVTSPQVITHNLNTRDVIVQVYNGAAPYDQIDVEVEMTTVNTVTLKHNPGLPTGYRAVVLA